MRRQSRRLWYSRPVVTPTTISPTPAEMPPRCAAVACACAVRVFRARHRRFRKIFRPCEHASLPCKLCCVVSVLLLCISLADAIANLLCLHLVSTCIRTHTQVSTDVTHSLTTDATFSADKAQCGEPRVREVCRHQTSRKWSFLQGVESERRQVRCACRHQNHRETSTERAPTGRGEVEHAGAVVPPIDRGAVWFQIFSWRRCCHGS